MDNERQVQDGQHPSMADLELARTGEATEYLLLHASECEECRDTTDLLGRIETSLRIASGTVSVSQATDQAIGALIDERIGAIGDVQRRRPLRVARWVWAAAALVVLSLVFWPLVHSLSSSRVEEKYAVEDVNRDGNVDILDAFAVADKATSADRAPLLWDMNSDGRIDQVDVDLIAAKAVSVSGGEG